MPERVREIRFKHFRGLPDNVCVLKGKNLAVLGGNGKGKSGLVDGFEFVFSGRIGRFHGAGTGAIDAGDAVRHVRTKGEPAVELWFTPTNACVRRQLSNNAPEIPQKATVQAYMASHPPVGAFILRRSQILEFIWDQDATRYQKYIQLLGLSGVDALQKTFVDAAEAAENNQAQLARWLELQLAAFREPTSGWTPTNLASVLNRCSDVAAPFGVGRFSRWDELDPAIGMLESKRLPANRARLDALNRAIVEFQRPLPPDMEPLAATASGIHAELRNLRSASLEAAQSGVIDEGISFFEAHPDITSCPLCEQTLADGYSRTFERLKIRSAALQRAQELASRRRSELDLLTTQVQRAADQLAQDLEHEALIEATDQKVLRDARASALRWVRQLRRAGKDGALDSLVAPSRLSTVQERRSSLVTRIEAIRNALIPSDESRLENAVALLRKARGAEPGIRKLEDANKVATQLMLDARVARTAFTQAREEAIQKAFDRIAAKVLEYYGRLHDPVGESGSGECSNLAFTQTSRAAAGGLRLVVDFLGLTGPHDPRSYLSEGHLDSLGLCLYLGTVRTFNPAGSLLVLDDVLTSIDQQHRFRVAELLFEEFGDYQVVLTTHDEFWFQMFQSSAHARGEQDRWRFSRFARWTLERGPESADYEGTWGYIDENLTEAAYRELGGPLRVVLEDFLKRVADKIELEVRFKADGKYTSGDFVVAGIQDQIRDKLIQASPADEAEIKRQIGRVFGMGDLINFLSHDNPGRLEVTFEQATDFVGGLKSLTARCKAGKLMKGAAGA